MTDVPVLELEEFALELARTAGGIAAAQFRRAYDVDNKSASGFDPVTSADRAIERALRAAIVARYPDHGIVAEEEGARAARSACTWFIDPIDGTRSFMTGSPLWGTLIGLVVRDVPLFGLVAAPALGEIYFGGSGGSWLIEAEGRRRLRTRACRGLADAALAATHPDMFRGGSVEAFRALAGRCLLTRFGGDCYNYALLAAGFVDLVVEEQLKPFDIVPLIPVIAAAGGVVTDWEGRMPLAGGRVVAAGTPELHAAALDVLQNSAQGA